MKTFVPCIARCGAALLTAVALLAAAPGHAASPRTDLLSGSNWLASADGVSGWIPAYAPYPNPVTMPNPYLNPQGIRGELMWYWPGPGAPGAGSPHTTAYFRRQLDLPPGPIPQVVALVAADDQMTLKVNGTIIGSYTLAAHKQPNGQPEVVAMDLTPALHSGANQIDIEASDVQAYHYVYVDSYNIAAPTGHVLVALAPVQTSLIGDKDNFHPGDAADVTPKSPHVEALLAALAPRAPSINLDEDAVNQAVGLTHPATLAGGALLTSASVKLHIKMTGDLVDNDVILFNQTAATPEGQVARVVALADLLGFPPQAGAEYTVTWNLARTPIRNAATDSVTGAPDQVVDLLPMLQADGHLDVVLADDTMVDYSELSMTSTSASATAGDLNNDGTVDRDDVNILLQSLNAPASGPNDPRDLDHDGSITALDVRKLVAACTLPLCAK
ncbi:dockerin type I domain-containing protein [Duganella callida]|uniref:Dockerin domain-containing protein n=1 Tax=Duganella callida TaxID=2561932 RepID=A0A4Y9RZK1_9BURK|nr:dockerin type I domain-containing protein [Duganella callida]TFW13196.1 hypothetical protein E4L98_29430 [Duganella callida]